MNPRDWSNLPFVAVYIISTILIEHDVVDYYAFCAVCNNWRSCGRSCRRFPVDHMSLRFRPRSWIMLSDGDSSITEFRNFLNIISGRILRLKVPALAIDHKIVAATDGLLLVKYATETRLLNPLTGRSVKLPPLRLALYVLLSTVSVAVTSNLVVFLCNSSLQVVQYATEHSRVWTAVPESICFVNTLLFQDHLYVVTSKGQIKRIEPDSEPKVTEVTPVSNDLTAVCSYLVELAGEMLLVREVSTDGSNKKLGFEVFMVDLIRRCLKPIKNIGDHAIFVACSQTLSLFTPRFPSIKANAIYFVNHLQKDNTGIYRIGSVYHLSNARIENLNRVAVIEYIKSGEEEGPEQSVRPYSLVDHIICYCYRYTWSKGLMFHARVERIMK